MSCSVCLISGDVITCIIGTSRASDPASPDAPGSMSAVMPTLNRRNAASEMSSSRGLPFTHQRIGDTAVVIRRRGPQYLRTHRRDVLEVDRQRRLRQRGLALVVEPAGARTAMMAGRADEADAAAPFGARHLGEVLEETDHHRQTRRVVERRLEVAVHVREDGDVLVGLARQRADRRSRS